MDLSARHPRRQRAGCRRLGGMDGGLARYHAAGSRGEV